MKNNFTPTETIAHRKDKRNDLKPFKVVASGLELPLRFETEKQARAFFDAHVGTALLSYNQNFSFKILAYKHKSNG